MIENNDLLLKAGGQNDVWEMRVRDSAGASGGNAVKFCHCLVFFRFNVAVSLDHSEDFCMCNHGIHDLLKRPTK